MLLRALGEWGLRRRLWRLLVPTLGWAADVCRSGGGTRAGADAAALSDDCSARYCRLGCRALYLRLERLSGQRDFTPLRAPMVWCITEREGVI